MRYVKVGPFVNGSPVPPISAATMDRIENGILGAMTAGNVLMFGAKGDGSTDDSVAVQAAVEAVQTAGGGVVYFPSGVYVINSTITFYPGITLMGDGMGVTSIGHNGTGFLFKALSPNAGVVDALYSRTGVQHMSIYAQNGIQLNDPDVLTSDGLGHPENYIMGPRFEGLRVTNPNTTVQTATNAGTNVLPTVTELRAQGVGLQLTACYDTIIENSYFEGMGIGVFLDDCDISNIHWNGFRKNSRHIHNTHHATGGARTVIEHNEILTFFRMGGVYTDVPATTIEKNYFEPVFLGISNTVMQILRAEVQEKGLRFVGNSIDCGAATQPLMSLSGFGPTLIDSNHLFANTAGALHTIEVRYDSQVWDLTNPNPVVWGENPGMNRPASVGQAPVNPYVFAAGNIPVGTNGGAISGAWPFVTSPNTGRLVLRSDAVGIAIKFQLQSPIFRTFKLCYLGRMLTGPGFRYVRYIEGGSTTAISSGNVGISATTGVQAISETVTVPTGAQGTGYFEVGLQNDQIEYERVQLVPVP